MLPKDREGQKRSIIQERKGAARYGGVRTPGSGNGWIRKADVRTDTEMVEFKSTRKGTYAVKSSDMRRLWNAALLDGRTGVLEIDFAEDGVTVVVLDVNDYDALKNRTCGEGCTGRDCDFCT